MNGSSSDNKPISGLLICVKAFESSVTVINSSSKSLRLVIFLFLKKIIPKMIKPAPIKPVAIPIPIFIPLEIWWLSSCFISIWMKEFWINVFEIENAKESEKYEVDHSVLKLFVAEFVNWFDFENCFESEKDFDFVNKFRQKEKEIDLEKSFDSVKYVDLEKKNDELKLFDWLKNVDGLKLCVLFQLSEFVNGNDWVKSVDKLKKSVFEKSFVSLKAIDRENSEEWKKPTDSEKSKNLMIL